MFIKLRCDLACVFGIATAVFGFLAPCQAQTLEWSRQLGSPAWDSGALVSADVLGNVFIAGATQGSLGGTNAGDRDMYVSKYDQNGDLEWMRQFGTEGLESSTDASADGLGNLYVACFSLESFVLERASGFVLAHCAESNRSEPGDIYRP